MHLCSRHRGRASTAGLRSALILASVLTARSIAERQENGLDVETISPGECSLQAQQGDVVSMHYNGTLASGAVFDSSYKRHAPFEFKLGEGLVIEGWDQGLLDMCVGEERRLVIPPELAYGSRRIGKIPPDSTLTFDTILMAINGVTAGQAGGIKDKPSIADVDGEAPAEHKAEASDELEPSTDSEEDELDQSNQAGAENGECRLLGPFALIVQTGLGLLALFSLVWKRWRERPRRPMKVWFFDVSKQVVGSALLHLLNVLMSMISSKEYQLASSPKQVQDEVGRQPNPCSFYLINIAVDTTLGIPILVLFLKILHRLAAFTPLARPPESIKSGHYGQPPQASWWVKQSTIYFVGLLLMKFCVLGIFTLLPWIALVGDWALRWTEGSEALQIVFVMFIFPLIMNALQYYIVDSFIKDSAGSSQDANVSDGEEEEEREPLHRGSEYEEGRGSEDADKGGAGVGVRAKRRDSVASDTSRKG